MKRRVPTKTVLFLLIFFLLIGDPAPAQEARLTNVIVTNTRDDFLIYLTVKGAFRDEMKKAVLSGVPTSFSFLVNLYQDRKMWFDRKIVGLKLIHTIKYDNLKKQFTITRSWKNGKPAVTQSFSEAQKLMTEINAHKVLPLSRLEKGRQYQLRAKAELSKLTLPFYLHRVLFFVSLWDFETDWYTVDFIY